MYDSNLPSTPRANRPAWNKGKLTGPKPPLRPGHVWLIRARLQLGKAHTRPGTVQSRHRQQAAGLRSRRAVRR